MLGPYLPDSKNSDATFLNYIIKTNAERMKDWTKDGNTFVVHVDRGFRDSCQHGDDIFPVTKCIPFTNRGCQMFEACCEGTIPLFARIHVIL